MWINTLNGPCATKRLTPQLRTAAQDYETRDWLYSQESQLQPQFVGSVKLCFFSPRAGEKPCAALDIIYIRVPNLCNSNCKSRSILDLMRVLSGSLHRLA